MPSRYHWNGQLRPIRGVAQPAPRADPGPVVGLALLPGVDEGQAEAWAAVRGHARGDGTNVVLHYASDPSEPLLDPVARVRPLPDAPQPSADDLTLAAFGKSECQNRSGLSGELGSIETRDVCFANQGSTDINEMVLAP